MGYIFPVMYISPMKYDISVYISMISLGGENCYYLEQHCWQELSYSDECKDIGRWLNKLANIETRPVPFS